MYERHFGLTERPFALTPDPAFLYRGRKHQTALTMLEYALANRMPVVAVTGRIGTGKTTLIRHLVGSSDTHTTVGVIANTHKHFGTLAQWVALAFGLAHETQDKAVLHGRLVAFLRAEHAEGRKAVLIVDEAQNLDIDTLEELRLLTNVNSDKDVLLQLVLCGQPELRDKLARPELEQFAQRIAVDYHIEPLDPRETREYVQHRLVVAGASGEIFQSSAFRPIYAWSAGVPRLINALADTALVYAYAEGKMRVNGRLVQEVIDEKRAHGTLNPGFGCGTDSVIAREHGVLQEYNRAPCGAGEEQ